MPFPQEYELMKLFESEHINYVEPYGEHGVINEVTSMNIINL